MASWWQSYHQVQNPPSYGVFVWQAYTHSEPAVAAIGQLYVSAVSTDDCPRDGEAKPRSTTFPTPRFLKPLKGLEDVPVKLPRDSRTIIIDPNQDTAWIIVQRHTRPLAILCCVVDEVGQGSTQGDGATRKRHRLVIDVHRDRMPGVPHIVADALK